MADFREQSTDPAMKPASTAAVAADVSMVVALSPNSNAVTIADLNASGALAALNATLPLPMMQAGSAAIEISGTWVGTITFEGTVSGSVWNPINGTASSTSTPAATTTVNGLYRLTPGALAQIRVNMTAFTSGSASVSLRSSNGTSGIFANQILPAKITDGVSIVAIKPASTAAVATDAAVVVALSPNSPVTLPAITKGTQGATGVMTQDLKDAGRSARTMTLDSFAIAAVAETIMTMSYSSDNGTLTTGTSYQVTAGKRLRMQQMTLALHTIAGNTTAASIIIRVRALAAGTALVTSPVQAIFSLPGVASINMGSTMSIPFPDGWEFVAATGIAITATCAGFTSLTAAPKLDIAITAYEY